MLRSEKGFTLIELMVVVVIIGILAAIALPNFIAMQDRAKEASVKSNMHTIQLGMEDYATRSGGVYPVQANSATTLLPTMPGGVAYPANPFTGVATVVTVDPGVRTIAQGQTAATAGADNLGVAVAWTASGAIHISSGFSDEVSPASSAYSITGNGKSLMLIERTVLLALHN